MCGIAGILNLNNQLNKRGSQIQSMSEAMKMRGPDSNGVLVAGMPDNTPMTNPGFVAQASGRLFLAHRRLSVIDLTDGGWQPFSLSSQRYWIVYNGEIYNFRELRLELSNLGTTFETESDTEVLLAGYIQWGKKVLDKLHGMFAFAIWDERTQTLFLARDRLGIKPLYYIRTSEDFIFGSDIKTLIASNLFRPKPNIENLFHAVALSVAPRPLTCFEDVFGVPPGHWLEIDATGKMIVEPYWQITTNKVDPTIDAEAAASLLDTALKTAVARCQVSDTPVGSFLSGGLDSGIVTAMAARNQKNINAFTLAFPGMDSDESDEARATARLLGIQHNVRDATQEISSETLLDMTRCYEEPFPSLAPNYLISEFVHDHGTKVVLNGLGADELFAGYGYYSLIKEWESARKRKWLGSLHVRLWPDRSRERNLMGADSVADFYAEVLAPTTLNEDGRRDLFNKEWTPDETTGAVLNRLYVKDRVFTDHLQGVNYLDMLHNIGNHHVYRADQFTMRFSLEARFPFLDHELVELAFSMPSNLKFAGGAGKKVVRDVAKQYVSPESLASKKKGFGLPVERWMRGALGPLVKDKLDALGDRAWINRDEVEHRYSLFNAGNLEYRSIWALVSTELWLESFFPNH